VTATVADALPAIESVTDSCDLLLPADVDREVWLQARRSGIGSSDASAVVGVSEYDGHSPLSVWLDKRGENPLSDRDNLKMKLGRMLEPTVADLFEEFTGKQLRTVGLVRSVQWPWMLASCDRLIVGESAGLEIKTSGYHMGRYWDNDEIANHAMVQVLHSMAVTGFDTYHVAALIGGDRYEHRVVERTPKVQAQIDELVDIEAHFWRAHIVEGIEPEAKGQDLEILAHRNALDPDKAILADELLMSLFRRRLSMTRAEARIKKQKKEITARIKQLMGEATQVTTGDGKVFATHKTVSKGDSEYRDLRLTGHGKSFIGDDTEEIN
jgi:putative phage-type endonuclease